MKEENNIRVKKRYEFLTPTICLLNFAKISDLGVGVPCLFFAGLDYVLPRTNSVGIIYEQNAFMFGI